MEFWREGRGWVVGWDSARHPYCALIGGADWTFELDEAELFGLLAQFETLKCQWEATLTELMDEESLTLSAGNALVELELSGIARSCTLRVRVCRGRAAEGRFDPQSTPEVTAALVALGRRVARAPNRVENS